MEESEIDIRGIVNLLWRQKRLILITVFVILGLASAVVFALTPIYSASALILVDPSRKNLLDPETQMASSAADSARIDSEVEILKSDTLLLRLAQEQNLVTDPEFGVKLGMRDQLLSFLRLGDARLPTGEEALQSVMNKLRNAISIQRRGLTNLIAIQVRSESPQHASDLTNALADIYIADQVQSKVGSTLASRDVLQRRINQAREAIVVSENSFDDFIAQNIDQITNETGRDDIAQMQNQIQSLEQAREQSARTADMVQTNLNAGNWQAVVDTLQSDAVAELERQRQATAQQLASVAEGSQAAIDLRAELERVENNLKTQATTEVANLRQSVTSTQNQESSLRQDIRTAVIGSNLSADVLTRIYELQQNAELARAQYQTLLARVNDLDAQASLQIADSRIVSPALPPSTPAFPNTRLILLLAGLAALGLGVALAFLYENFIGGFATEEQVEAVLKTPVAAAIPRQRTPGRSGEAEESVSGLVVTSPLSVFSEAIRRVRAGIEQAMRKHPHKIENGQQQGTVIMVSSTAPGEGKSTMALSLARSYALSGQSALLIDCDLRKPSIHRQLGIEPNSGLVDYLTKDAGGDRLADILQIDKSTGVSIIVGARRSDVPTDQLVTGKSFARLLEAARKNFDVVVLDTPPVGPVVDGLYIAQFADVIAFVIRWASTSQSDARKALASLMSATTANTEILAVLNQQERSRASYRNKYAGYYNEVE